MHPSSLRTSSDSSLGGLANALGELTNALGGLMATPDDVFSWRGEGVARSWKTEQDLELCGNEVERHRVGEPNKLAEKTRNIERIVCI